MNISSVIVIPHPDHIESVQSLLREIEGVEVHAVSPEGKIIVTLEVEGDRATAEIYNLIGHLDGVLSASMVFHQNESDPEALISSEA
ncbi:MAG: chaperone NapD [Rhodocyclaceae bacterium]|nr:chaperone NapD [Rhodocyclaceae bacterium]MDP1956666.1 chaperone NapD [Rhodocyclaceae bacterium]